MKGLDLEELSIRKATPLSATATWGDLLKGKNGLLALALTGGVALHAINVHIVTTVLPSVVQEIGGLDWYAWNTTLFVVASIIGAAMSVKLFYILGARQAYISVLMIFAIGSVICAFAISMPLMLIGRSIQGLGGGILAALSYALIRVVFPSSLWSRAVALVSGMWGVATLCGPAVGGLFAQLGHWRWAFWILLPVSLLQGILVSAQLRPYTKLKSPSNKAPNIPMTQIFLLTCSVLAVAAGSMSMEIIWQSIGLISGLILGGTAIMWDKRTSVRLLPSSGAMINMPLGATYASIALLLIGTTTEIFVPYFLQTLHNYTPLAAGYLTALMAGGWSLGSLLSSGNHRANAMRLLRIGPMLCTISLLALALVIPNFLALELNLLTLLCGLTLFSAGAGVGIGWPHLVTQVLTLAPANEEDMASAAITTVQLYGMAIGAAAAGLVVNTAGLNNGTEGVQSAAVWLFGSFAIAPALAAILAYRIIKN